MGDGGAGQALEALERWAAAAAAYERAGSIDSKDPRCAEAAAGRHRCEQVILSQSTLATLSGHQVLARPPRDPTNPNPGKTCLCM
jgi:hypothetical protein